MNARKESLRLFVVRLVAGLFFTLVLGLAASGGLQAASNVTALQRTDTRLVDITYDLSAPSTVSVEFRTSATEPWQPTSLVAGDVGAGIAAGMGREIVWNSEADLPPNLFPAMTVRVLATPDPVSPPGPGPGAEPYSVSGQAVQIADGVSFAITNGTRVTVTAVQYLDNECITATFNILGHWEIHGIVGPARIVARYDSLDGQPGRMMDPQITEVTGPTQDLVLNLVFGDDTDVEQCPDLSGAGNVEIVFADLDAAVRNELSIGESEPITVNMAAGITSLPQPFTRNAGITDLSGAEYLTGLRSVDLSGNPLADISPLADLPLVSLDLSRSAVTAGLTDPTPLGEITTLESLALSSFLPSSVGFLSGLLNLENLLMDRSQVTDLSGLGDLPSLEILNLSGARSTRLPLSDLSGLEGAPSLRWLFLNSTSVEDIGVLSTIPSLESVNLENTFVSNLSPLLALPNLGFANLNQMPNVDWANYENGWAIVDALVARGATVNNDLPSGPVSFPPYILTGVVEPATELDSVLVEVSSLVGGSQSQVVEPGEEWSFSVRHDATVTPSALGFEFFPESATISRASPTLVFTTNPLDGLRGQVVDPEGAPVAGQQLSITRTDLEPTETVIVETNSAGNYFAVFPLVANLVVEPIGSTYALETSDGRPQPVQTHGGFVVNFTAYPRPDETLAITRSNAIQLVSTLDGSTQAANIVSGVGAVWSPNGSRLAVTQKRRPHDRLVTVDADGSNLSVRAQGSTINSSASSSSIGTVLTWAENGEIAFVCQYTVGSLEAGPFAYTVNATSGSPSLLIPGPSTNNKIPYTDWLGPGTLSPDGGRFILNVEYDSPDNPTGYATLWGTPGSSSTTSAGFSGHHYAWSPDGSEIAYSSASQIHVVSVDESNSIGTPVSLTAGDQPAWSPDGRWIVFVRGDTIRIRPRHAAGDSSAGLTSGGLPSWRP